MKENRIVLDLNKLDMRLFYRQKMLLIGLAEGHSKRNYDRKWKKIKAVADAYLEAF